MITGQIMQGPDLHSNLIGWADHFLNGGAFGIVYVLLIGGFPQRGRAWHGAVIGALYGVLLGTGFLLSPATTMTGAGHFGSEFGPRFAVTVYLAHALFGATLGALVHRFGRRIDPLWVPVLALLRRFVPERATANRQTGRVVATGNSTGKPAPP